MKAVRIEEFGGSEVLRTAEITTPEPGRMGPSSSFGPRA